MQPTRLHVAHEATVKAPRSARRPTGRWATGEPELDYARQQRDPGKHVTGFVVVVGLHVLLIWALVSGLGRQVVEVLKAPIETKIIEEVKPPPPPPPDNLPPPPKTAPPPPSFVPPPEIDIKPPPAPAPVITTTTVAPPPEPVRIEPAAPAVVAPPAPPAPPPRVAARKPEVANLSQCVPTSDDYPRAARRAEATGTTRIRLTVDAAGKLTNAEISHPSGMSREHRMLDKLALDKLSTCTFRAGIDSAGKPVGGSWEIEYVWKLTE